LNYNTSEDLNSYYLNCLAIPEFTLHPKLQADCVVLSADTSPAARKLLANIMQSMAIHEYFFAATVPQLQSRPKLALVFGDGFVTTTDLAVKIIVLPSLFEILEQPLKKRTVHKSVFN
jgi:hypothetical protein